MWIDHRESYRSSNEILSHFSEAIISLYFFPGFRKEIVPEILPVGKISEQ